MTARKLSAIRTKPSAGRTKPHGAKAGTATVATAPSTELDRELTRLARAAQDRAYAPYSHFRVGAALVTADGQVFTGANIENASYGLTVCAERNAVAAMVMAGARDLRAIYVASDIAPPASPCGMCRQTLLEFARDPASTGVIAIGPGDSRQSWTLAALLPSGFTGDQLARRR